MSFLRHRYYDLKPFIPGSLRMFFRQLLARHLLSKSGAVWPVNPAAGEKPKDWAGWPNGKKFALVLTHDVEGAAGLEKCRDLMRLEQSLGFRSSFNFIPEGSYRVPSELRQELADAGFEVGVHDLRHDGKLYRTREDFFAQAGRINRYLREWNVVGFRSGFMHHNLEWLHALDIKYDMSTFDTDPFEPQPDPHPTIFPFWVPAPATSLSERPPATDSALDFEHRTSNLGRAPRAGYLELPYTLPQDSTLFLVLRQQSNDIWKRKLEWIVARGGMALLDTHPDYMRFDSVQSNGIGYPVEHYRGFLEHVRVNYGSDCWFALPREMAEFFSTSPACARPANVLGPEVVC